MPISASKRKSDRKWRENNYDKICIQVHKGIRDNWKASAESRGMSLAGLIVTAVTEYLDRHPNSNPEVPPAGSK